MGTRLLWTGVVNYGFFFNVGGFEKSSKLNFRGKIYTEMMENRC